MRSSAMALICVVGLLGLGGCQNNKAAQDTSVAPPPPMDPAPTPAPAPVAAPTPVEVDPASVPAATGGRVYTVKKGDTLYGIARREYNDPRRVKDIINANPGIDPNKIIVGQKLNMP